MIQDVLFGLSILHEDVSNLWMPKIEQSNELEYSVVRAGLYMKSCQRYLPVQKSIYAQEASEVEQHKMS